MAEQDGGTVLVVDDNPQNVDMLEAYLTAAGYEVECAYNGEEALQKIAERRPDLILLDVMMPGLDGYEVCERLKGDDKTRLIPIVMVTALSDLEDRVRGIEAGADDFLTKPVNKPELFARVRSLLRVQRFIIKLNQSKDEFLSIASHELRTPMTAIKGYLSMILDGDVGEVSQDVRMFLDEAYKGNDRLLAMVEEMLDVSRIEQGRMQLTIEDLQVEEIAAEVVETLSIRAKEKDLELRIAKPEGPLPAARGDADKLRLIVTNLVGNALKFTPQGSITVKPYPREGEIVVEVADTGPGISPEDQEKLFKKFSRLDAVTTSDQDGSTGLGLYITRSILDLMEGSVWVESEVGRGSTFAFSLPIADPKAAETE